MVHGGPGILRLLRFGRGRRIIRVIGDLVRVQREVRVLQRGARGRVKIVADRLHLLVHVRVVVLACLERAAHEVQVRQRLVFDGIRHGGEQSFPALVVVDRVLLVPAAQSHLGLQGVLQAFGGHGQRDPRALQHALHVFAQVGDVHADLVVLQSGHDDAPSLGSFIVWLRLRQTGRQCSTGRPGSRDRGFRTFRPSRLRLCGRAGRRPPSRR